MISIEYAGYEKGTQEKQGLTKIPKGIFPTLTILFF